MLGVLTLARSAGALPERELDEALATPGYQLFIDHHNRFSPGSFTWDHFRAMLAAAVSDNKSYIPPASRLARMLNAFSAALLRLQELEERLAQIEQPGWQERASARALRWLPEDASLAAEVYFLLDGASGGYVLDTRIGMDLLQPNGRIDQLEGVIAHELHHVGFASLAPAPGETGSASPEAGLAGLFLGEGSATALVYGQPRPGDEGYGEWEEHERQMPGYFAMTRQYLKRVAGGEVAAEQFEQDVPAMYLRGRWGVGYAIGAVMVRTVLSALGKDALLACMRRPETFIETYRRAVSSLRAAGAKEQLHDL
jgi:hypothetical protein